MHRGGEGLCWCRVLLLPATFTSSRPPLLVVRLAPHSLTPCCCACPLAAGGGGSAQLSASHRRMAHSSPSTSALNDASMMLECAPTVRHLAGSRSAGAAAPSPSSCAAGEAPSKTSSKSMETRVTAADVPSRPAEHTRVRDRVDD